MGGKPRVVALVAAYNEERFIETCLSHLFSQGIEVYLIDNGSTDRTVEMAEKFRGRGLIDIATFPRHGVYSWRPILQRKEELAHQIEADWFMNVDPDELRLSPRPGVSLPEAFKQVEDEGWNAVNFQEFTFTATREEPDHDHPNFVNTMKHYYAFGAGASQVKAWKKQPEKVDFSSTGGHRVAFSGARVYPVNFIMKHYLMLSVDHAVRKYVEKTFDPREVETGWHVRRANLRREHLVLPSSSELLRFTSDEALNASSPRMSHFIFDEDHIKKCRDDA